MLRFSCIILLLFSLSCTAQPPNTFKVRKRDSVKVRPDQINLLWLGMGSSGGSTKGTVIDNFHLRATFRSKRNYHFGPESEYYYSGHYKGNMSVGAFFQKRYQISPSTVIALDINYHYGLQKFVLDENIPTSFHNGGLALGFDWWFIKDWRLQLLLEYQVNAIGTEFEEHLTPMIRINLPIYLKTRNAE